jgi:hypothetical protein
MPRFESLLDVIEDQQVVDGEPTLSPGCRTQFFPQAPSLAESVARLGKPYPKGSILRRVKRSMATPRVFYTALRDILESDGSVCTPVPPIWSHFINITRAGTARSAGLEFESPISCRRRPRRRRCPGHLWILRTEVPEDIQWQCPDCQDRGFIREFRGTPWDLSGIKPYDLGQADDEQRVVTFPRDEYRALLERELLFDGACEVLILRASPRCDGYEIEASVFALEEIQAFASRSSRVAERCALRSRLQRAALRICEAFDSELPSASSLVEGASLASPSHQDQEQIGPDSVVPPGGSP